MTKEENKLMLQKIMVGHFIEDVPEGCNKKISYIMQGDGLWQIRKNKIGTFYIHMAEAVIPGLKSDLTHGWTLNVPKVPMELWKKTVSFFKDVQKVHNTEAYLQFFYDTENQTYTLHCPKQEVSTAAVKYTSDPEFEKENIVFVMEIHSHGNMSAFFSGTDNADEKSDRFFGVVGKVSQDQPEMKFRLMIGGFEIPISFGDVFEMDEDVDYPKNWLERIEKKKPVSKGKNQKIHWTRHGWKAEEPQGELFNLDSEVMRQDEEDWENYKVNKIHSRPLGNPYEKGYYEREDDFE